MKGIPAGGYVKIPGMTNLEEIDPADEARTYRQQPFHNRIIVASAGSFMHFVMAFVLAWAALVFIGGHIELQGRGRERSTRSPANASTRPSGPGCRSATSSSG